MIDRFKRGKTPHQMGIPTATSVEDVELDEAPESEGDNSELQAHYRVDSAKVRAHQKEMGK